MSRLVQVLDKIDIYQIYCYWILTLRGQYYIYRDPVSLIAVKVFGSWWFWPMKCQILIIIIMMVLIVIIIMLWFIISEVSSTDNYHYDGSNCHQIKGKSKKRLSASNIQLTYKNINKYLEIGNLKVEIGVDFQSTNIQHPRGQTRSLEPNYF